MIDTEDLPLVKSLASSYSIANCSGKLYVKFYRRIDVNKYEKPYLHREIMNSPDGKVIDHVNGNTLDNRRSVNLREATQSENLQNRQGAMTNSETGVRGVFRRSDCDRWEAQVVVRRKKYRSLHKTIEAAEQAAIQMRSELLPFSEESREFATC